MPCKDRLGKRLTLKKLIGSYRHGRTGQIGGTGPAQCSGTLVLRYLYNHVMVGVYGALKIGGV